MSLDKSFVLSALLRHNYFPVQKKSRDEIPPIFTARDFSGEVASKLIRVKQRQKSPGWDTVEYRATRFNGVPRLLSIPHPLAHAHLSICISENWPKLRYTANNQVSLVRPREHRDGRIIIMDYESSPEKHIRSARLEFGKRFRVHTDIANFFPSIYSHAFPWGTVGFTVAKNKRSKRYASEWFNQLDEKLRWNKRAETQGVAIGPATSNIVAESILARVDAILLKEGFEFVRYIDDYTAYCVSEDKAQEFIRRLSEELSKYKLLLSIKKTEVQPLPRPRADSWVTELALALPTGGKVTEFDAISYLELGGWPTH